MANPVEKKMTDRERQERKKAKRGTADEVEVLKMILFENRTLAQRVFDRLRYLKETAQESPIDSARKKQEKEGENKKRFTE